MNKNKQILKYCPNFYKIINFDFFEDDHFTEKLIAIYEESDNEEDFAYDPKQIELLSILMQ